MKCYYTYATILGDVTIAEEDGFIVNVNIKKEMQGDYINHETKLISNAYKQLDEYLRGDRKEFDLPLKAAGTKYKMSV